MSNANNDRIDHCIWQCRTIGDLEKNQGGGGEKA